MRKIRLKKWREYAKPEETDRLHPAYRKYFYYARRRVFNTRSLFVALFGMSLFLSLSHRAGTVLSVSLAIFATYLYLRARSLAEHLKARRIAPTRAVEREQVEVRFDVVNEGSLKALDVVLIDRFAGSTTGRVAFLIDEPLAAGTVYKGEYKMACDGGMGVFKFGPMELVVGDGLGLFEFTVEIESRDELEVFPRLEQIPQLPLRGAQQSFFYGLYDLPMRGASVNFIGIRDYVRGDPLRYISWRLSVRNGKLLVKEFEKIANTSITLLLNMDARDHMGRKSESTWEYAKDTALAIVSQQMSNGNSLQLFSQRKHVEMGQGEAHAHLIARTVFDLAPEAAEGAHQLVERTQAMVARGSTVIFIGPLYGSDADQLVQSLLKLTLRQVAVYCVLIEPSGFVIGKVQGEMKAMLDTSILKSGATLQRFLKRAELAGISCCVIEGGKPLGNSMLGAQGQVRS